MPSWSLSEPSCSTSWSMAVYLSSSPSCLTTCRLVVVLSIFGWFGTSHCSCRIQSLQSKTHVWGVDVLVCEDSGYSLKYGSEGDTLLWRRSFSTSTCSKSCTLRRYQDFRLGCIFFLFLFSLVLSSLSKCNVIAFTLHLRGGVKGIIVIAPSLGFGGILLYCIYIAQRASINTHTVHSLFHS
jgi:hypothetical protein